MRFWDAPLIVPGKEGEGDTTNLPRLASEILKAWATYIAQNCAVKTDGERLEVSFPNSVSMGMGIFSGSLQYTVYHSSNLLGQEVIAILGRYHGFAAIVRFRSRSVPDRGAVQVEGSVLFALCAEVHRALLPLTII